MYIVCGLGNPGRAYEATRHNMGFITMDILSQRCGISIKKIRFKSLIGEGRAGGEPLLLVKPQTFMNRSGDALFELMNYYRLPSERLLLVYDDIDLPVGSVRMRPFGGPGTHNGMRSVIYRLGTEDFPRIRIGVGRSGHIPLAAFVTGKWTEQERPLLADAVSRAADGCELWFTRGINDAMNIVNRKDKDDMEDKEDKEGSDI